jgi:predicted RNA-binding protein (virulence factor B family)
MAAQLGQRNLLTVLRSAAPGLYLDGGARGEILLPGRYIPQGAVVGGKVDVFVYRDSEDRMVATTEQPVAMVNEMAFLEVAGVRHGLGAFLRWGLEKDLLLPIREMDGPVNPGDRVVVLIVLDRRTDRLIATARFNRMLDQKPPHYHEGESVRLMVASKSPLGFNLVVNNQHRGLIYHTDIIGSLKVGDQVQGYVRAIRPDGKLDLALGQAGFRRIGPMAEQVMKVLTERGGRLPYHDNSIPEEIRDVFGMSKKAFKQAIGQLFKERRIIIDPDGISVVKQP